MGTEVVGTEVIKPILQGLCTKRYAFGHGHGGDGNNSRKVAKRLKNRYSFLGRHLKEFLRGVSCGAPKKTGEPPFGGPTTPFISFNNIV